MRFSLSQLIEIFFLIRLIFVTAVACLLFAGDHPALAGDSSGQNSLALTGAAGVSNHEGAAARQLYQVKCARCHKFYDPAAYTEAEWTMWMNKMKKSKLKPDQKDLLARYLDTFRSNSRTDVETAPPKTERVKPR